MRIIVCFLSLLTAFACTTKDQVTITFLNPLSVDRMQEMVAIDLEQLAAFTDEYGDAFVITDEQGTEIAWQLTYDNQLIFPASVKGSGKATYRITPGTPAKVDTIACGKQYPERLDDVAWENDRIAFRTYGPALEAWGVRAFGYDIWAKCVPHPVVESRYAKELNKDMRSMIDELQKNNKEAAQEMAQLISYHIDHGDGLDFYSVGPTLGAGTSALLDADSAIVYPYCYRTFEVLDNGPLRFTVKLTYAPLTINGDTNVVETRLISLDAGSQLNRITVSYENLSKPTPLVTGIVLHGSGDESRMKVAKGIMGYADPATEVDGQLYVGTVFPDSLGIKEAKPVYFSDSEKKVRNQANGHLLAYGVYQPGMDYTYFAGGGWSKWGFDTAADWYGYLTKFAERVRRPLEVVELGVTIKN